MIRVLAGQSPYTELHLAHSGSQSQCKIQFILPAHGAKHIIMLHTTVAFGCMGRGNLRIDFLDEVMQNKIAQNAK